MKRMLLAFTVLVACTDRADVEAQTDPVSEGDSTLDMCLTDDLRGLVGQDQLAARAQVPALHRIIAPGDLVTQEYLPNRVNVDLNARGVVSRVWCG